MEDTFERLIVIITALFVIVDPIGTVPTMLGLVGGKTKEQIRKVILQATLFGAGLLIVFGLAGTALLNLLHINLDAFRIAGGALLFWSALEMMRGASGQGSGADRVMSCGWHPDKKNEGGGLVGFVPLGMPSLAGPGAITTIIVFTTDHTGDHLGHFLIIALAVVFVFLAAYLVLRSGQFFQRFLGDIGTSVLSRIMGLFMAAIAVQFVIEGVVQLAKRFV